MKTCFCGCAIAVCLVITGHSNLRAQSVSAVLSPMPGTVNSQTGTGAISGTVIDERGTPMPRVIVHALGQTIVQGGRQIEMSRSVPTDESGRFRIDRLPAQSFVVAAVPSLIVRIAPPPGLVPSRPLPDQPTYALTYFPGVIDRAQAQPIPVPAGSEQTIFIELKQVQPVHVRGTVSSPSGRSTNGLQLMLQRSIGSSTSSSMVGYVQPDGSFDVLVPPGNYTLMVNVSPGAANSEFAATTLEATGSDIDGVALMLGSGGTVNGQIVFDGPSPGGAPLGVTMFFGPVPGSVILGRPVGQVPVAEDWTFQARGLFGTFQISTPAILMRQYRPGRIEFDGRVVGNAGVEIKDGEHQLVIHLAPLAAR